MSAYLVNEDTLDLLASVISWESSGKWDIYIKEGTLPPRGDLPYSGPGWNRYATKNSLELKRELALENLASVYARYPQDRGQVGIEIDSFRVIYLEGIASYEDILGAIRCYRYQACESDTWESSYAHAIIEAIQSEIVAKISGNRWEYTRPANSREVISLTDLIS